MIHPKHLLDRYGIEPKKSLGQNFLFDESLLDKIVQAADLTSQDDVLEVGPGLGALTRRLAIQGGRVVAVELDQRLLPVLEDELGDFPRVELVHGDVLGLDPADWFDRPFVMVANVPYYITGAILRHLLAGHPQPRRMVMTVQKEVAERLAAQPPRMSLLAISVQYYGQVQRVSTVKAGAFWPRPDVDSAVIRIDVEAAPDEDEAAFFRVVRAGFSEKRKQLKNNLKQLNDESTVNAALAAAGVDGRRRAETLSLAEWRGLVQGLDKQQSVP